MNDPKSFPFPHPRHCPTPAEVSSHKTMIYELDQEIYEVTDQINILQNRLQLLRKKKENHASYISVQTTSISLSNFKWTQKPIQPHRFVELTDLDLEKVGIRGTLGDHLVLPNLKHPNLVKVFFKELKDNKLVNQPFSDKAFLEGAPMLETIALSGMPIGDSFIEGLKSCASLRHLHLEQCKTDLLAIGLQDYLLHNELLPSLETLKIINSWPDKDHMYFDILRWCFPKKRPDVIQSSHHCPLNVIINRPYK